MMKGYERTPEMTEKLIAKLSEALRTFPQQRLGQLLHNLTYEFIKDLWNIYDEDWIELLEQQIKGHL